MAINTNELRLNNIVGCSAYPNEMFKIAAIRDGFVYGIGFTKDRHVRIINERTSDDLEPIPLTPTIFESGGFVHYEDWGVSRYDNGSLILHHHDFALLHEVDLNDWRIFNHHKIEYLHQLQNLYFALTGIELTFNPSTIK